MGEVLTEFVELLTSGIVSLASGIAEGANTMVTDLFLTTTETGTGLSTFGGVLAIFAGLGLAVGFTTLIFNWIRSLGN